MNKKITALVLSAMLILSMFTYITASAETTLPESITTDYVAGAVSGNKYTPPESGGEITVSLKSNSGVVTFAGNINGEMVFKSVRVIGDGVEAASAYPANGALVQKNYWDWSELHVNGKQFIIGAQVKALEGTPKFTAGFYEQNRVGDRPDGFAVTDGVDITWSEYAPVCVHMTMTKARNNSENMAYSHLSIGMPEDPEGTTATTRSFAMKPESLFIGYEAAHDIVVEAENTSFMAGSAETVDLTAKVVNQVGTIGYLPQNFTWYALNAERTDVVDGLIITEGEEGTATLTVDSTVPAGEYDIVAISDDYTQMVKGVTINVKSFKNDYVAGEIKNQNYFAKFTESWGCDSYTLGTTETMIKENDSRGDGVAAEKQEHGCGGVGISVTSKEYWAAGNTIVFGAKVKNNGGLPKVKFAVWQQSYPALNPIEAPGITDGTLVLNTEYEQIGFTMPISATGVNGNDGSGSYTIYQFGFPETPAGEEETTRSVIIDNASVYLGIEEYYDIKVKADTNTWIHGETEQINLDCDIVNQVGVPGSLNQDVSWYAMDAERTQIVDGIEITESGLGDGKAKVVVDPYSVSAGKYAIVAVSNSNGDFIKGIEIEVEYTPVLAELNLEKSGNTFTASAKLLSRNSTAGTVRAMIVIVALDENGKAKDYKVQKITNTYSEYGTASEESTTLTVTDDVHRVNAFLWETTDTENPGITDTTLKELAPMQTLLK